MFWQDAVGKFFIIFGCPDYLQIIFMLFHTTREYDAKFMLRSFLERRVVPQLLMVDSKILSRSVEYLHFLDWLNSMSMVLKSTP
jgi:hypothetical protein